MLALDRAGLKRVHVPLNIKIVVTYCQYTIMVTSDYI